MGRDKMENFHRRGLTARQWKGWIAYVENFPLPHDRADINTALTRATLIGRKAKAEKLIPRYGYRATKKTEAQLKDKALRWVNGAK